MRRALAASEPNRWTRPPGNEGSRSPPSRSGHPSSCRSRWPCAIRSSGRSRYTGCPGTSSRRSCPCCADEGWQPGSRPAISRESSARIRSSRTRAVSVTPAPITVGAPASRLPSPDTIALSSRTPRSPITVFGVCCRRFMLGSKSVPPPITRVTWRVRQPLCRLAHGARRAVGERRQAHHGRTPAVASTPASALRWTSSPARWRRARRRLPRVGSPSAFRARARFPEMRPDRHARVSPRLLLERLQDLLRGHRHLVDPDADGVVDRVGQRRHDR